MKSRKKQLAVVAPPTSGEHSAKNKLNDLTAKEWIQETISVWIQRGLGKDHQDAKIEREHPAPFSFTDISRLIRFFTKKGQIVLDPFVGIGSTLKACAIEKRKGIGVELHKKYTDLARKRLQLEVKQDEYTDCQVILTGDARKLLDELNDNQVDFIVTSPPYWNILHKEDHKVKQERIAFGLDSRYGASKMDLGNIEEYDVFLNELTSVFIKCSRILKPRKYMAVIVGDFRDKGKYHMFHSDLATRLEAYGFTLKGITILHQRHKRIFPYGYPFSYVPNFHHQYILILENNKIVRASPIKKAKEK